jgi:hypothetical protein
MVTKNLQYLCCDTCGSMVTSCDRVCCDKRTSCILRTTFRIEGSAIDSVFLDERVSASEEDGNIRVTLHEGRTKSKNGHSFVPVLLQHSKNARKVKKQVLDMLKSMNSTSARLMTQSSFRTRPYTMTASSFKRKYATDFACTVNLAVSSE